MTYVINPDYYYTTALYKTKTRHLISKHLDFQTILDMKNINYIW